MIKIANNSHKENLNSNIEIHKCKENNIGICVTSTI